MNTSIHPIAFMVMPYGERDVEINGQLAKLNFDDLWEHVYQPLLDDFGFEAVRADADIGSVILQDMLGQLVLADLVLADLTMTNVNVYYEVGVRHSAAINFQCVLLAAEGAQIPFDLAQIRRITYTFPKEKITARTSKSLRDEIVRDFQRFRQMPSPVHAVVPGYPSAPEQDKLDTFREHVKKLQDFSRRVQSIKLNDSRQERERLTLELAEKIFDQGRETVASVRLETLSLVRDHVSWDETVRRIKGLPDKLKETAWVQEQLALATSKSGDHILAISTLQELIGKSGATPERCGLIGGRYKKLYDLARQAKNKPMQKKYLSKSIVFYEQGMWLDHNEYYCACNLPNLYKLRNDKGDKKKREHALNVTIAACQRVIELKLEDGWVRPTLLGVAFEQEQIKIANALLKDIEKEGAVLWNLETVIPDLKRIISQIPESKSAAYQKILKKLIKLKDAL